MAGTSQANQWGWASPVYYFESSWVDTFDNGELRVNLGSRLQVYGKDYSGQYPGGIGTGESFCVIGNIMCYDGIAHTWFSRWMIVFTGPDGYTPTYGVLEQWQLDKTVPWGNRLHWFGALKSYNRSITFWGTSYPAGSRIWGNQYYSPIDGQLRQGYTLGLTGMDRANTIDVIAVANPDGSNYQGGPGEYAVTRVTNKGINCDIEGYW